MDRHLSHWYLVLMGYPVAVEALSFRFVDDI
jgi:hypothetical protein